MSKKDLVGTFEDLQSLIREKLEDLDRLDWVIREIESFPKESLQKENGEISPKALRLLVLLNMSVKNLSFLKEFTDNVENILLK